ncbi:MAG TPA: hypothetical protein VMV69_18065 [Pirellulales bacterium]|nr:hypothetical protein [Pirellulales bacterium]
MRRSTLMACVCFAWTVVGQAVAHGAPTVQERATDMLALVGGERLFGILVGPPHGGKVGIVVDRQWFRKHLGDFYRKTLAGEDGRRRAVLEQLRDRLAAWRQRREEPKLLANFIQRSLTQTEQRLRLLDDEKAPPEPSQLVLVEIPLAQVRKQYVQPAATRRVLALAWQERLPGAEEQTAAALIEQLRARKIDHELTSPNLSDRLGAMTQDERQWAAKVALVEYEILGKPHYKGAGGKLVRDDGGQAPPDLTELLAGLLQDQVGDLLGELLDPAGGGGAKPQGADKLAQAMAGATREAAAEGLNGLRVSYLSQDPLNHKVTVRASFLARMPDGAWLPIWEHTATADTTAPRKNEEEQLAKDPQVAKLLELAKGLGIDVNDERLRTALRHGVVTSETLQAVNRAFIEFMLPNVRRLDGPLLAVPDGAGVK